MHGDHATAATPSHRAAPKLLRAAGPELFPHGPTALAQTESLPDGTRLQLPAQWMVVGRS